MGLKYFDTIGSVLTRTVNRFPVTICFLVAMAAYLESLVMDIIERGDGVVYYYLSAGILLSLLTHLVTEDWKENKKKWIITGITQVILAIDALTLETLNNEDFNTAIFMAHASVMAGMVLGIFFLPFRKEENDIAALNFSSKVITNAVLTWLVCGIACGGTIALVYGFIALFGIEIAKSEDELKIYLSIVNVTLVLLAGLIFMARIPDEGKYDKGTCESRFKKATLRYMFIPLVLCYMAVLYVYMLKAIVSWELPEGTLTWMVSVMMTGVCIVLVMLYPTIRNGGNTYEQYIARWLPIAALPLVVFMSIGLICRLMQYGITANRLYVVTLNLWYYVICSKVFITRMRLIRWIPLSFAALFIISSAQPLNYNEISRRVIRNRLNEATRNNPPQQTPFTDEQEYYDWLRSLPDSMGQRIYDDVQYLYENYYRTDIEWIVDTKKIYLYRHIDIYSEENDNIYRNYLKQTRTEAAEIPLGYKKVLYKTYYKYNIQYRDTIEFKIEADSLTTYSFTATKEEMKELKTLHSVTDDVLFVPSDYYIRGSNKNAVSFEAKGYLFMN